MFSSNPLWLMVLSPSLQIAIGTERGLGVRSGTSFIIMKGKVNHILSYSSKKNIFFILLFFSPNVFYAQCAVPINRFPFNENFESSNGNWTTGARISSDWAWGIPSKPVINTAASGLKCWMTGELKNKVRRRSKRMVKKSVF